MLAVLFAPTSPVLGRYEVCTDSDSIESFVRRPDGQRYRFSAPESAEPLEALGGAGDYDRARVARLYGGTRPRVARGWAQSDGQFESITLVSPYPEPSLDRLNRGTLVIRWIIQEHP